MNIMKRRQKTIEDLKDKEYRDAFAREHIDTGIPFQIRALRKQQNRKWTQKELAKHAGMAQETISRIEDPNYGKLTLETLKRLASAFDIGLMVRFVPFSELVDWELSLTPASLEAISFPEDFKPYVATKVIAEETKITVDHKETVSTQGTPSANNIIVLENRRARRGRKFFIPVPQKLAMGMTSHN
jgi:transcriptional regulator with XRE-family HTH domain